jgi:hypothetical protein
VQGVLRLVVVDLPVARLVADAPRLLRGVVGGVGRVPRREGGALGAAGQVVAGRGGARLGARGGVVSVVGNLGGISRSVPGNEFWQATVMAAARPDRSASIDSWLRPRARMAASTVSRTSKLKADFPASFILRPISQFLISFFGVTIDIYLLFILFHFQIIEEHHRLLLQNNLVLLFVNSVS